MYGGVLLKLLVLNNTIGHLICNAQLVKAQNLTYQVVMSFHSCGSNVGDACNIPLPGWVTAVAQSQPNIWYHDEQNTTDTEYLSLGVDYQALFQGRTPLQIYADYMQSFADNFKQFMPQTINQVQVGMGPAGELRYPAYQTNKWTYCGIGEFQCYDTFMLANLSAAAQQRGEPQWGKGGPDDAGTYDSDPDNAPFFQANTYNSYASTYGEFFLAWYSDALINHGSAILSSANTIFQPYGITIAAKVAGIHWWFTDPSHAAELTSGYFNTDSNNAYLQLATMFKQYGAYFDFTCLEMTDYSNDCDSAPEQLVQQTILAAKQVGIGYSGENALELCSGPCNQGGFNEIYAESTQYGLIQRFTYLRLSESLLSQNNWAIFTAFVQQMAQAESG